MSTDYTAFYDSPLGWLQIQASATHLLRCHFIETPNTEATQMNVLLEQATAWLDAYFQQSFSPFTLPIAPQGTPFRHQVWQALRDIPCGTTCSYGDIAQAIGKPKAVRAIGQANHHNPLTIFVPCHRVIGHDGHLVGYGGGLPRKAWLLKHEGVENEEINALTTKK